MTLSGTLMKVIAVIAAWAVTVQVLIPNTNVAGWDGFTDQLESDPFEGLPSAPVLPENETYEGYSGDCADWDVGCWIGQLGNKIFHAAQWFLDALVWGLTMIYVGLYALVAGIVWVANLFIDTMVLLFGMTTFGLEDDLGNPISINPVISTILLGVGVFVWMLLADWIIVLIRGREP